MKKLLLSALVPVMALGVLAANEDPVLMTVNKVPVHLSEFEYLYKKNNAQQLQPQSLDQYVDMFVNYKLKVADALANGMDTTTDFRKEYAKFRADLADPYLKETKVIDSLVNEAYKQTLTYRKVKHLMMAFDPGTPGSTEADVTARLDSIRSEIIAGRIAWDDAVAKYSIDRGSNTRGGTMGWMNPTRYPYKFVEMAYNTPVGEISPVVNSGFGLHIIDVEEEMPNPGEVNVEHILKLTVGNSPEQAERAKAQIDSLYNVLMAGADFKDLARRESEDPGSKANGGDLGWFGKGAMVAPFDSAAFAMVDGEISKPVATSYGYHILHKLGHREPASLEKMRPTLEAALNGDERAMTVRNAKISRLKKQFDGQISEEGLSQIAALIAKNGQYDSIAIAQLSVSDIPVYTIGDKTYPVKNIMPNVVKTAIKDVDNGVSLIRLAANHALENDLMDLEREELVNSNEEYRNLINEYRDGILLFNIANEKVWERASKDTKGLEKFFKQHRSDYKWDAPKFKAYVIFAENDSILEQAREYLKKYDNKKIDHEALTSDLAKQFKHAIKAERVIAGEGDNPITDYLAFGKEKPENKSKRWPTYFAFNGRLISAPEEAMDVRGQIIADYQAALEKDWLKYLKKTYPVVINRKVLDTIK